jgi:hypothetical protein
VNKAGKEKPTNNPHLEEQLGLGDHSYMTCLVYVAMDWPVT